MSKYLELALSMAKTRGDWSNGFYRVKDALKSFSIETSEDQAIVDEVAEYVEDEDTMDGRIFRDCDFNYNWIYKNKLTKDEQKKYNELLQEYYDEF